MVRRIGDVQAASQHGEGSPAGRECSFMSHPVDAARHPADNGKPEAAQLLSQRSGDANPIECGMARANDGDGLYVHGFQRAVDIEDRRWIRDVAQQHGIPNI